MRKLGKASLAFFYCDFRDDKKKDCRELLSSLLVQLCDQSDAYRNVISKFYLAHRRGSQHPGDNALQTCFTSILQVSGQAPVFVVIDALDELPNTTGVPSPGTKSSTLWRSSSTYRYQISTFVLQAVPRLTFNSSSILCLSVLFPCMARAVKSRTLLGMSSPLLTPIQRCEDGKWRTRI